MLSAEWHFSEQLIGRQLQCQNLLLQPFVETLLAIHDNSVGCFPARPTLNSLEIAPVPATGAIRPSRPLQHSGGVDPDGFYLGVLVVRPDGFVPPTEPRLLVTTEGCRRIPLSKTVDGHNAGADAA